MSSSKALVEDVAQAFSKTFKDASKHRVRQKRYPDVKSLNAKLHNAIESKRVISEVGTEIVVALKALLTAVTKLEAKLKKEKDAMPPAAHWEALENFTLKPYEEYAGLLRAAGYHVPQVRNFKLARSLYHAFNSIVVVYCAQEWWSNEDLVMISGGCTCASWAMEVLKVQSDSFKRAMFQMLGAISRDGEQHNINSATWYMSGMFILAISVPKIAACMATLALGLGDPAAAFVGSKFGSIRVFGKKTLEGTLAFWGVTFLATYIYLTVYYALPLQQMLVVTAVGATVGALSELFCTVIDDNLFVPVCTAAAITFTLKGIGVDDNLY